MQIPEVLESWWWPHGPKVAGGGRGGVPIEMQILLHFPLIHEVG